MFRIEYIGKFIRDYFTNGYRSNISVANIYEVADGFSIDIFTSDLG